MPTNAKAEIERKVREFIITISEEHPDIEIVASFKAGDYLQFAHSSYGRRPHLLTSGMSLVMKACKEIPKALQTDFIEQMNKQIKEAMETKTTHINFKFDFDGTCTDKKFKHLNVALKTMVTLLEEEFPGVQLLMAAKYADSFCCESNVDVCYASHIAANALVKTFSDLDPMNIEKVLNYLYSKVKAVINKIEAPTNE